MHRHAVFSSAKPLLEVFPERPESLSVWDKERVVGSTWSTVTMRLRVIRGTGRHPRDRRQLDQLEWLTEAREGGFL